MEQTPAENNIVNPVVRQYLDQLNLPQTKFLRELRAQAEQRRIPIIGRDTEALLGSILLLAQPERILEIGTAIGYSSLYLATILPNTQIITVELDPDKSQEAEKHICTAGLTHQIEVRTGDGIQVLRDLVQEKTKPFDLIFIDAAKGHYQAFFQETIPLWSPEAVILSDNILFQGVTASDRYLKSRRDRTIMNRMRSYLTWLQERKDTHTSFLPVGDGVAITIRKESMDESIRVAGTSR